MFKTRKGDNLSPAKIKTKKGITLIALILTIIVLLILAGISLNLVFGENGITGRAVNAGKIHNLAGAKEKFELDVANYAGDFYQEKYGSGNLTETLLKAYIIGKIETETVADYTVDEGPHIHSPFTDIIKMDNRVQKHTITMSAFSKDIQEGLNIHQ